MAKIYPLNKAPPWASVIPPTLVLAVGERLFGILEPEFYFLWPPQLFWFQPLVGSLGLFLIRSSCSMGHMAWYWEAAGLVLTVADSHPIVAAALL